MRPSIARAALRARAPAGTSPSRPRYPARTRFRRSSVRRSRAARAPSSGRTAARRAPSGSARRAPCARAARSGDSRSFRSGKSPWSRMCSSSDTCWRAVAPPPPALPVARLVDDDAVDPGAEGRLAAEAVDGAEDPQEDFLRQVERLVVVAQQVERELVDHALVLARRAPRRRPRRGRRSAGSAPASRPPTSVQVMARNGFTERPSAILPPAANTVLLAPFYPLEPGWDGKFRVVRARGSGCGLRLGAGHRRSRRPDLRHLVPSASPVRSVKRTLAGLLLLARCRRSPTATR